jgi:hypothetical protein
MIDSPESSELGSDALSLAIRFAMGQSVRELCLK